MMTNFGRLLHVPADFRKKASQSPKSAASVNSNFTSSTKVISETYFAYAVADHNISPSFSLSRMRIRLFRNQIKFIEEVDFLHNKI